MQDLFLSREAETTLQVVLFGLGLGLALVDVLSCNPLHVVD